MSVVTKPTIPNPGTPDHTGPLDAATGFAQLVVPELTRALDRLDPATRHVCGYALGLWNAAGRPEQAYGKGIRGTLVLLSTQVAGAPLRAGLPAAAAVELVHNFSLVHDDLMDGDRTRRHRTAVWAEFGSAQAILAGDAMLGLASELLAECESPWANQCLTATTRRLIAGQMSDLAFERRTDVSLTECLRMAEDKTAALLACAASLGVVLLDGSAGLALELATYGTHLGMAFQLTDDLLGIWGRPEASGKPVLSDLRCRKKSLPVVAALCSGGRDADRLAALYLNPDGREGVELTQDQLEEAADLIERTGARRWAERRAAEELRAALALVDGLPVAPEVRLGLEQIANRLSGRES